MKQLATLAAIVLTIQCCHAQIGVKYNPAIQPAGNMQYFGPSGNNLFVGDCIPFSHNNTYYLYWLLDSAHHSALNGLGGHQWVVSTSTDLRTWKHFPVVIGIDEKWEKSICTGSVVYHDNLFYAFYATRLLVDGKVNEQLSYAISKDGIHFDKQQPNPFYTSAPGYSKRDFRDPKVFVDDDGAFHLLVSSRLENAAIGGYSGALVHMVSKDLKKWEVKAPLLSGQRVVPECPDYFKWNDWYYLIYSQDGDASYVKSKKPYGPWEEPETQVLAQGWFNVAKTASFKGNRVIAAAWVPSRRNNADNQGETFGGNVIFRELAQTTNGTLTAKFPSEMIPATEAAISYSLSIDSVATKLSVNSVQIDAPDGIGTAHIDRIPDNCRITLEFEPQGPNEDFGLVLKSGADGKGGYKLVFSAENQLVELHDTRIYAVKGLDKKVKIDLVISNGIIDVDINNERGIVNRLIQEKGSSVWFFTRHGKMKINNISIHPLAAK